MRLWLLTTARTAALTPSVAISVVTHAVLVSAAVYGTDQAAHSLQDARNEQVSFLAPPDRLPGSLGGAEQVHYLPVGAERPVRRVVARGAGAPTDAPVQDGTTEGDGTAHYVSEQTPQAEIVSDDSVYSVLSTDESAARVEGSAAPVYPPEMLRQGMEGLVVARFVIDTTGRADPESVEILQSSHAAFVVSVRDAVPGMRFSPAMVRGHHVRQMVQQSFAFRIQVPTVAADNTSTRTTP